MEGGGGGGKGWKKLSKVQVPNNAPKDINSSFSVKYLNVNKSATVLAITVEKNKPLVVGHQMRRS